MTGKMRALTTRCVPIKYASQANVCSSTSGHGTQYEQVACYEKSTALHLLTFSALFSRQLARVALRGGIEGNQGEQYNEIQNEKRRQSEVNKGKLAYKYYLHEKHKSEIRSE